MDKKLYNLLMSSQVIIFDFDGTIADTEKYSWIAHNKALEKYGVQLTNEDIKRYIGNNDKIIFANIEKDFNIKLDFETHFRKRIALYVSTIIESNLQPFSYVYEILENFKDKKFYILSSNNGEAIKSILTKWNLLEKFENVYSMLDLNLTKEHCLNNSKAYFGVETSQLTLLEDSTSTINIANKLGTKTILIESNFNKDKSCNCNYKIKL